MDEYKIIYKKDVFIGDLYKVILTKTGFPMLLPIALKFTNLWSQLFIISYQIYSAMNCLKVDKITPYHLCTNSKRINIIFFDFIIFFCSNYLLIKQKSIHTTSSPKCNLLSFILLWRGSNKALFNNVKNVIPIEIK